MEKTADVLSVVWDNLSTDYEQRVNTLSKSDDKYPNDTYATVDINRDQRLVDAGLPAAIKESFSKHEAGSLPTFVKDSCSIFDDKWHSVERPHRVYSKPCPIGSATPSKDLPAHKFQVDLDNAEKAPEKGSNAGQRLQDLFQTPGATKDSPPANSPPPNDPLQQVMVNVATDEMDDGNKQDRMQGRTDIFKLFYDPKGENTKSKDLIRTDIDEPYMGPPNVKVLVKAIDLHLVPTDLEPMFCSLTLFDVKSKKRISESFYFDVNTPVLSGMLGQYEEADNAMTKARQCIFSLNRPHKDVFLVLRIEKVLEGEVDDITEPYVKGESNEKAVKKMAESCKDICSRLGAYRQHFAWSPIPIFDENGTLFVEKPTRFNNILRFKGEYTDTMLCEAIEDLKVNAPKKNRLLSNDSYATVEVSLMNEDFLQEHKLSNIRDPSFRLVKPIGNVKEEESGDRFGDDDCVVKKDDGDDEVVRKGDFDDDEDDTEGTNDGEIKDTVLELQDFPVVPDLVPAMTYQNLLYIYPQSVDLRNRGGNLRVRNIAMKVQVMSDDSDPHSPGLPIVYSHGSGEPLKPSYMTAVTYHSKNPSFSDEIKIELPPALTDKHHLLFTFYHITCKAPDKKGYNEIESVIAYAVCPLLEKGRFLPVDDYEMPLAIDLPPHHLSKGDLIKYVDGKKPLFKIKTTLVSSVYARDYELYSFQKVYDNPNANDQALLTAINGLRKAQPEVIAANLPLLFSYLLNIIEKRGEQESASSSSLTQIAEAAFRVMASIVQTLEDSSGVGPGQHSPVLLTYLKYHLKAPKAYTAMAALMVQCLNSGLKKDTKPGLRESHRVSRYSTLSKPLNMAAAAAQADAEQKQQPTSPEAKTEGDDGADETGAAAGDHDEVGKPLPSLGGQLFSSTLSRGLGAAGLEKAADTVLRYSWFFCDLIIKSMMQAVGNGASRNNKFSQKHMDNLAILIKILSDEVVNRRRSGVALSKAFNRTLAFFLSDLFDVIDRGVVLYWVCLHMKALNMAASSEPSVAPSPSDTDGPKSPLPLPVPSPSSSLPGAAPSVPATPTPAPEKEGATAVLAELKFDFLGILSNYEHYIPLNLPVAVEALPPIENIPSEFARRHFLASLIISEVVNLFDSDNNSLRSMALVTFRDMLNKHDKDERYNAQTLTNPLGTSLGCTRSEALQRIATIYFPYVLYIIDAHEAIQKKWDLVQQRNGLVCFMWILSNMPKQLVTNWWKAETPKRIVNFFTILRLVENSFEYVGKSKLADMNKQAEGTIRSGGGDAKSALESMYAGGVSRMRRTNTMRATTKDTLRNTAAYKTRTLTRMGDMGIQASYDLKTEAVLSYEMNQAVLDIVDQYTKDFRETLPGDLMFDVLFDLLIYCAKSNLCERAITNYFKLLRTYVAKFEEILFATGKNYLAKLCPVLISFCNYASEDTRACASGLIFVLMKHNFNQHSSFARMKLQITIALSALIGPGIDDDYAICRALSTLREYARTCTDPKLLEHSYSGKSFVEQTYELSSRLFDIVRDSMMISRHRGDAEMTADLYYAIARSYMDTPGLRITYLKILMGFHVSQSNYAEAAMCKLHIAALVSEYIQMLEPTPGLPQGSADFKSITPNVLEEATTSKAAREADEEGMCEDDIFSVTGLQDLLIESVDLLKKAQLFESADEVYKLLLPIYAKNRDYRALADAHGDLKGLFEDIISTTKEESRTLGTYYRIGFYGVLFGDLSGKEYIYKEPRITLLQEITNRLKSIYTERFGDGNFVIIQTSNKVDVSTLDQNKAYVQLTSVEPYFEAWELKERVTYFDRRTKLTRFMFETPFTSDGKSHGTTATQFKRKTIVTVGNSFPYVKKRLPVSAEEQIILTPIENAIELIESRAEKFRAEVTAETPTTKQLQMMLSGTVRLQVNAGPFEICDTFLGSPDDYSAPHVRRLKKAFRDFLKAVKDALVLNNRLISNAQVAYQRDLEKGFEELDAGIAPYLKGEPEFLAKLKEKKAAKAAAQAQAAAAAPPQDAKDRLAEKLAIATA